MVNDNGYWFEKDDDLFGKTNDNDNNNGNGNDNGNASKESLEKVDERNKEETSEPEKAPAAQPILEQTAAKTEAKKEEPTAQKEEKKPTEEDFFKALREDSYENARAGAARTDPRPMVATKSKRGFGEPERPVRKKMLKKLLKYEYRALFKFLLPVYIVILAVAAIFGLSLYLSLRQNGGDGTAARFLVGFGTLYVLSIFGVSLLCIVNITKRYYTHFFSGEGYLTLTIPATPEEHILAKLISAISTIFLTVLVAIVSVLIIGWTSGSLIDVNAVFQAIGDFFKNLSAIDGAHAFFFILEIVLLLIASSILQLQIIYCCICVGQLFVNKNRKSMGWIVFVLYLAVTQFSSVFTPFLSIGSLFTELWGIHLLLWLAILVQTGISVGAFFLQRYILKNKINLA